MYDDDYERMITHRIHVWYIYLHLVDFDGKCRLNIPVPWILWVMAITKNDDVHPDDFDFNTNFLRCKIFFFFVCLAVSFFFWRP